MTARLDVALTLKTTEQNRIVRTGKSVAEVTSNKKLRSRYCTIGHEASRSLFATAEPLVYDMMYIFLREFRDIVINYRILTYLHYLNVLSLVRHHIIQATNSYAFHGRPICCKNTHTTALLCPRLGRIMR